MNYSSLGSAKNFELIYTIYLLSSRRNSPSTIKIKQSINYPFEKTHLEIVIHYGSRIVLFKTSRLFKRDNRRPSFGRAQFSPRPGAKSNNGISLGTGAPNFVKALLLVFGLFILYYWFFFYLKLS